jgi:hypothetical protein
MRSSSEAVDMAAAAARRSSDGSIVGLASYQSLGDSVTQIIVFVRRLDCRRDPGPRNGDR